MFRDRITTGNYRDADWFLKTHPKQQNTGQKQGSVPPGPAGDPSGEADSPGEGDPPQTKPEPP